MIVVVEGPPQVLPGRQPPVPLQLGRNRSPVDGGKRGGKPDYTGLDVILVRDDKIAALYVFLDSSPS